MRLMHTAACAAVLAFAGSASFAATVDFTDEDEGAISGAVVIDGVAMTLSANDGATPYLDEPSNSDDGNFGPGGLGVCSAGVDLDNQCTIASDDNVDQGSEVLTIDVNEQAISDLVFGNHGDFIDFTTATLLVNGDEITFAAASAMTFFGAVSLGYVETEYYVRSMEVVPLPAAGLMLLGGLGGLAAMKRRKKA